MPLAPFVNGAGMTATQVTQLIDLLKGVMHDQAVTLKSDYSVTGDVLRIDTVTASGKNGIGMLDAGTVKWEIIKDTDQGFKLWDSARGAYVAVFASNGDITLPSTAKLLGSADFRTAARLIAGADPGAGGAGDIVANRGGASPGSGVVYFGSSTGTHYLYYDGTQFNLTDDLKLATGFNVTVGANGKLQSYGGDLYIEANSASSIVFRPTRNNATDQTIFDSAGAWNLANGLRVPPSRGGTMAPNNYGTVPVKIQEQAFTNVISVTFSSLPQGFRNLKFRYRLWDHTAVDYVAVQLNGVSSGSYAGELIWFNPTYQTLITDADTKMVMGYMGVVGNVPSGGYFEITDYTDTGNHKSLIGQCSEVTVYGTTASFQNLSVSQGFFKSTSAITSVTIFTVTGNQFDGVIFVQGEP